MVSNANDIMNMYQRLRANPKEMLAGRFNIPANVDMNNPNDIIQHLLNTGQVTQSQVNDIMGMKNSPMIRQLQQLLGK